MKKIGERLFVSAGAACRAGDDEWAVVHACKDPCHRNAVGYKGNLSKDHENYLILEKASDLYLNIIDPPVPMFPPELFSAFFSFGKRHWDAKKSLLIHCNQGESRAPSLGLLFIAKYLQLVRNDSYEVAREDFLKIYPAYNPGKGLKKYLTDNWAALI